LRRFVDALDLGCSRYSRTYGEVGDSPASSPMSRSGSCLGMPRSLEHEDLLLLADAPAADPLSARRQEDLAPAIADRARRRAMDLRPPLRQRLSQQVVTGPLVRLGIVDRCGLR